VIYELRFKTREVQRLGATASLSDEQERALKSGAAQLFSVDTSGAATLVDRDDVLRSDEWLGFGPPLTLAEVQRVTETVDRLLAELEGTKPIERPIMSIRVLHSDSPAFNSGQSFESIAEFDGVVRSARSSLTATEVSFVLTWRTGDTFRGALTLQPHSDEYLVDHVDRVCGELLHRQLDAVAAQAARRALGLIFFAAFSESVAALNSPASAEDE
jgi:hypothetical protein